MGNSTTSNPVRERWLEQALKSLPPEEYVSARNGAITGTYAWWYLQHPEIFKWAGMAAFASHRVGLALAPYEFVVAQGAITDVLDAFGRNRSTLLTDLDLVRRTNNEVYADIGWAHLAYVSPDGGIAAVEEGLRDLPNHEHLRKGFQRIEQGRRAIERGDHTHGMQWIWEGNAQLLEHEQRVTVQSHFAEFDKAFDTFLTAFTVLDFESDNLKIVWHNSTSFFLYMATRGLPFLLKTVSLPDIAREDHRWYWVSNRALPIWKRVDASDSRLRAKLSTLAQRREWTPPPSHPTP